MVNPNGYKWKGSFDYKTVYVRGPTNGNQLEFVKNELAKDNLKGNVCRYSRNVDEFKTHISMLVGLILKVYQTLDPEEKKELYKKFIGNTNYLRDKPSSNVTWTQQEHVQLFQAIDHHYGDQPEMLLKNMVADKLRCLVTTAVEKRIKTKKTNLIKTLEKYHGRAPTVKDAMLYFCRLLQFYDFLEKRANDTYIYSIAGLFTAGARTGGYLHPGNLKVEAIMRKYVPKWNDIRPDNHRNYFLPKVMSDIANAGISLFMHDAVETKIVMMLREKQDDLMWKKFDRVKREYASAKTK